MNRIETERLILSAYNQIVEDLTGNGRSERLHGYEQAVRHRSKFESCGRVLTTPYGHEVKHWCRRPVCPTCATFWGRKLGRALISACPDAAPDNYRMVTMIGAVVSSPDEGFDWIRDVRRTLGNAIDYRRRTPGIDQAGWRAFGMAGALELDHFEAEDFARLGTDKQAQFRALGFAPERARGPQWVVTAHALIHAGSLGDDAVRAFFKAVAPVVHLQRLYEDKGLAENAEAVVGYAAKIRPLTTLAGGETKPWSPEAVASYVAATMRCSHGRQGFKLAIQPMRARKKSNKNPENFQIDRFEPMPVLIGF